jgi:AraC-like DNA-binding protein/quercetin dioxygenase-like cupin family protein
VIRLIYDALGKSELMIKRTTIMPDSPENVYDFHVHHECEIYVNISGEVSFAVGDKVYPIRHGDVLIIPPYEYHHCVYNGNALHDHYWILFSAEKESVFRKFFQKAEKSHHYRLSPENRVKLIEIIAKLEREEKNEIEKYGLFFDFMRLLQSAENAAADELVFDEETLKALDFIAKNCYLPIKVSDVAKAAFISVNTLERKFEKYLKISPREYIKKKRLARAVQLLSEGKSVAEACDGSGFGDCSAFISLFRKVYGITPKRYKNLQY